jgi:hypothetical protein
MGIGRKLGIVDEPKSQVSAYTGSNPGPEAIPADFAEGSSIPDSVKQQILKGAPELGKGLDAARLRHASSADIAAVAKRQGVDASKLLGFQRGTDIFAAPGIGFGLGTLAHEVRHVNDFLTIPNYDVSYNLARQVAGSYEGNSFEIGARQTQRAVLRANNLVFRGGL